MCSGFSYNYAFRLETISVLFNHLIGNSSSCCNGVIRFILRETFQSHQHHTQHIAFVKGCNRMLSAQVNAHSCIRNVCSCHINLQRTSFFAFNSNSSFCTQQHRFTNKQFNQHISSIHDNFLFFL